MPGGDPTGAAAIQRRTIFVLLLVLDGMFVVLHLVSQVITLDGETLVRRHEFIDLDAEISFPTWWQQSQLVVAAALCLLLAAMRRDAPHRESRYWGVLGGIFVFISMDEGAQLHEGLIHTMQSALDITGGVFLFAWVIPGAIAVAVFAAVFLRFWVRLPPWPRMLMALGGILFVVGALGLEMAAGQYKTWYGIDRGYYALIAVEEGLELVGASVFIFSLLTVMKLRQPAEGVLLRVDDRVT